MRLEELLQRVSDMPDEHRYTLTDLLNEQIDDWKEDMVHQSISEVPKYQGAIKLTRSLVNRILMHSALEDEDTEQA